MRRGDLGKSTFVGGIAFKWTVEYVLIDGHGLIEAD